MAKPSRQPEITASSHAATRLWKKGILSLEDYPIVDYILGLEKEDNSSNPARNTYYKTFSSPMQRILTSYCQSGGHLLVSGAYVGTDMDSSCRAIKNLFRIS